MTVQTPYRDSPPNPDPSPQISEQGDVHEDTVVKPKGSRAPN